MLKLKEVTICAVDCSMPKLAHRALRKSMESCVFGESILFTNDELDNIAGIRVVRIDPLGSIQDYSKFIMKELHKYISTPYVLIIQWDGYVLDHMAWNSDFLGFDYVGAKWPWHRDGKNVGNGGFSLRSKKLLDAVATVDIPFLGDGPEDDQICRIYREKLEGKFGIKFANEEIADQFSYERSLPDASTFGFHGLFNIWRYLDDGEINELSREFSTSVYSSLSFYEFFLQYFLLRRFAPLKVLYSHLKVHSSALEIHGNVLTITKDENFTKLFIALCDEMILKG